MALAPFDWNGIDADKYAPEAETVRKLLARQPLSAAARAAVRGEAMALVAAARGEGASAGGIESFLQEFTLNSREGLALLCLAEALLRIPDADTRDQLIAEKIGSGDWENHLGKSDSLFVNASTWGLMLTGRLVDVDTEARRDLGGFLRHIAGRIGEPLIRRAVATAVRFMGEQFVLGRTIDEALERAEREHLTCSFDMLGEGARTADDAAMYEAVYAAAIESVGRARRSDGPEHGHGVSVKLSALHPRYEAAQVARVWAELYPRLKRLAEIAARYDLNFTVDAEEADRLVLSMELFARLAHEPGFPGWQGLGCAVQAYQKRAPLVIAGLAQLAQASGRRLMIRLVKGAYWDTEIKRAQVSGRPEFPVFTTKAATDVNYLVCAKALVDAGPHLYPQFATHNAHTLVAVRHMAQASGAAFEFQRLHGMGETLYRVAGQRYGETRVRTYAPVGGHEQLLPYLVRRLLENGANTSFVHSLLDADVPVERVVADPIALAEAHPRRHSKIALPVDLFAPSRVNALGRDLAMREVRAGMAHAVERVSATRLHAGPIVLGETADGAASPVTSPADRSRIVGMVTQASSSDIERAVRAARAAQPAWNARGGPGRAKVLRRMADALETEMDDLIALLALEGGKTLNDGVAEVREAVDFCRYYAEQAERLFGAPMSLRGPVGERNEMELVGRGVFACISPWNFPLSIFAGQITAALAAGNAVLAKPAEQTPLIAARAVQIFHRTGLDPALLALLPGDGATVGKSLLDHPGVDGVAFTGGTDTAGVIARQLAARGGPLIPFIAETGGLNGMFVDTTALREQVIDDAILSAFGSAGQRCSALRILFVPKQRADEFITGIIGAMNELTIEDPSLPSSDIGPVIDAEAKDALAQHLSRLEREATVLRRCRVPDHGNFFPPILAEIPAADFLDREVFGPILHVVRYDINDLEVTAGKLAARRYGLTLGIHSRLDSFASDVRRLVPAGNVYVNRSIIGAVVGVQPFGGEGLSGTGPKAGGPNTLLRFSAERALSINIAAQGGDPSLLEL